MTLFGFIRLDIKVVEAVVDSAIRTVLNFVNRAQKEVDKQQKKVEQAATKAKKFADDKNTALKMLSSLYTAKEPLEDARK